MKTKLKEIGAGEFKTHCSRLIDEVQTKHIRIKITKRGKVVAELIPVTEEKLTLFGYMKGSVTTHGNIVEPTGEIWEADSE